jgi:3-oxoacyl-[acyl-carrier-protein] synthase II
MNGGIVITGAGLVSSLGIGVEETWRAVVQGRSGWRPLTALEGNNPRSGGEAPPLDSDEHPDREVAYLRRAVREALAAAGVDRSVPPPRRRGCILGTTLHGMRHAGRWLRGEPASVLTAFPATAVLRGALRDAGIGGPLLTTCAACSSGLSSIALAMTLLESGALDLALAGGYDPISEYVYAGFESLRLVDRQRVRPFCTDRQGMNIAEGYAVVVLEREDAATARGAAPLAHIRAIAETSDCYHLTHPHPEGEGALRALRRAMALAGVNGVGLVSAHATGTPNNDVAERAALARAFGDRLPAIPVAAFKANLGHALGGAGAAELILSMQVLRDHLVPPAPGIARDDVEFPDIALNTGPARPAPIDATANLSLGFGGANSCAILARTPAATTARPAREVLITGVGVISPMAIGNRALAAFLSAPPPVDFERRTVDEAAIAHLINTRRVRRMSDYVKLTLAAASLALDDAGVRDIPAFAAEAAALLGTTHGAAAYSLAYYRKIVAEGLAGANPLLFAEGVPNAGAAQLSLMLQIKGPCQTIIGSRTSGLDALALAALRVARGEWDRAIVSAAEEHGDAIDEAYGVHSLVAPPGRARAFGDSGFRPCAAAAAIVLESADSAQARDARPRGLVRSWAWASGEPPRGLVSAVTDAVRAVGSPPRIISSANGTWLARAELRGISRAAPRCALASITDHLGETFSAGPLAALAATVLGALPTSKAGAEPAGQHPSGPFALVSTDWTGTATALSIEPASRPEPVVVSTNR